MSESKADFEKQHLLSVSTEEGIQIDFSDE
jgi:hypothetical protein